MTTHPCFLLILKNRLGSITTTCKLFRADNEGRMRSVYSVFNHAIAQVSVSQRLPFVLNLPTS